MDLVTHLEIAISHVAIKTLSVIIAHYKVLLTLEWIYCSTPAVGSLTWCAELRWKPLDVWLEGNRLLSPRLISHHRPLHSINLNRAPACTWCGGGESWSEEDRLFSEMLFSLVGTIGNRWEHGQEGVGDGCWSDCTLVLKDGIMGGLCCRDNMEVFLHLGKTCKWK